MKSLLKIDSPGRAYAWLLGFGLARTILDYFWIPTYVLFEYKILSLLNTTVYVFTLYLVIPSIAEYILERIFSRPVNRDAVLRESVLIWIVYPAVTIISLMTHGSPVRSVEWFRYIPTFIVEYNFLPDGMIAVIPVLIVFYTWLMMRHSGADWLRSLISVLASLLVIYLVYYQWTAGLFLYFLLIHGPFLAFGYYTITFLIPLFPLAGRFQDAFGSYRFSFSRFALVATLISFGSVVIGLSSTSMSEAGTRALPPFPSSTANWNLRFYQLYDQANALAAYGFFVKSELAGRSAPRFQLFQPGTFFLVNMDYVTSTTDRLSYRDLLIIDIRESKLTFEWNQGSKGNDPFLETFQGTDVITECTARLDGKDYRCFLLDENLSADISRLGTWDGETFLALTGEDVSLIGFGYDDYMDGIIVFGGEQRRITRVSRQGWEISISFENGNANADCPPLAQYVTLSGLDPQPIDSPVRCKLVIQADGAEPVTATLDGVLEWIGEAQGY
jgi:hypothetical protein